MIDIEKFDKLNLNFNGIYRGLVENNVDPLDVGRVQIRIFGIHNFDGTVTPVDQLPWAEPALGLAWSGGYNVYNNDYGPDNSEKTLKNGRYNVGNNSKVNGTDQTPSQFKEESRDKFVDKSIDPLSNACGTGGEFVVPKRGNWVFVFFEGGNHENPIYFAMAPNARDWTTTKNWRNTEITSKIDQISKFKEEFSPRDQTQSKDDSWAPNALVNSLVNIPDLNVQPPSIDGEPDTSNRDIQCITSANGTTIVIDNRSEREQVFLIHKNYFDYTDKFGNKKIFIGKKRDINTITTKDDIEDPCHYEVGVEGNHELHILGNYDVYAKGRIHIQCDSNIQIDSAQSIGIAVREGDVDLIVENGNINADVAGNIDANIGNNLNAKIDKNANILVQGDMKSTVKGNTDLVLSGDVKINSDNDINITSSNLKIKANSVDLSANDVKISGNLHVGGSTKISGTVDIGKTTKIANSLYVDTNISCGGRLTNNGLAELGSPVILHGVNVVGGSGRGTGRGYISPNSPDSPVDAKESQRENGISVDKKYNNLKNGDSFPINKSNINPGSVN